MKRTKPLTAVLSLLLLLMASQAAALDDRQSVTDEKAAVSEVPANPLPEESEMPCDPNGMCSDPCKYFGKTAVFTWKGSGALLQYKGKIHVLTEVRKVAVRSIQHLTDVPGGSERLRARPRSAPPVKGAIRVPSAARHSRWPSPSPTSFRPAGSGASGHATALAPLTTSART